MKPLLLPLFLLIYTLSPAQVLGILMDPDYPEPKIELHLPPKQKYKLGWQKPSGWVLLGVVSFINGAGQAYTWGDRKVFEKKWNKDPYGFWGSQSWRMVYVNGDPAQGYKHWIYKHTGAPDFYHVADDISKYGYMTAGTVIGINFYNSEMVLWHWLLDLGISLTVAAFGKRAGMNWIRN